MYHNLVYIWSVFKVQFYIQCTLMTLQKHSKWLPREDFIINLDHITSLSSVLHIIQTLTTVHFQMRVIFEVRILNLNCSVQGQHKVIITETGHYSRGLCVRQRSQYKTKYINTTWTRVIMINYMRKSINTTGANLSLLSKMYEPYWDQGSSQIIVKACINCKTTTVAKNHCGSFWKISNLFQHYQAHDSSWSTMYKHH